jgi:PAS domain S-box-containing protein
MKPYDSRQVRLLVAVAAAMLVFLLRMATDSLAGANVQWLWFVMAVAFSARFGGFKPGLITAGPLLAAGYYLDSGQTAALALADNTVPFAPHAATSPLYSAILFSLTAAAICAAMQRLRMERFHAQHARHRLHDVLESTQDAILSVDGDLCCLYVNARAGRIAKKHPSLLYGKSLRTVFPETPASVIYRELQRTLREGIPSHFEDRVADANRWYEFSAYPAAAGVNIFVRDITAGKSAERERNSVAAALEGERIRLESVMRELPVGVVIASTEMRVELVNQKAEAILEGKLRPGDDLRSAGQPRLQTAGGEAAEPAFWPLRQTLENGERLVDLDLGYTRADGVATALVVNSLPLTGADGKLWGAMATYSDVTPVREMQRALVTSEARMRRLFDSPIIGVISGNEDSILEANDAFLAMLGYSRDDLSDGGLRWAEITPPEFLFRDAEAIRQLSEKGFAEQFEKEYIAKDGRCVPVMLGSAAYDKGHWSPWIAWVLDRTEHRKLETHLREVAKLESIGLLAGGIAHDFNNILTSILGNASLAFEIIADDHNARELLENTIQSTERAADLTRQLLAYAGKGRFVVRDVNLSELTNEIGRLVRTSVPRNVELELRLSPGLPPVEADATQLQQLIMNLVINGAEAVGDATGKVLVTVEAIHLSENDFGNSIGHVAGLNVDLSSGEYVSLVVQDSGCGMDEETLQRIFDPFYTTKFTGRGLGLAAAMGIVRTHNGALRVESAVGTGSKFQVLLPVSRTTETQPRPDDPPLTARGAGTVLVVDDEETIRNFARSALERYGYTVLLANDGRDALNIYRGLYYCVSMVVLDLTMPKMNGEETLANLLAINPNARVLLMSGFDGTETVNGSTEKSTVGFLQKPFTAAELTARVQELLSDGSQE